MSYELIRTFVREEIGRDFKRGESTDFYPWNSDTTDISVICDVENGNYVAYVTTPSGELTRSFPSEVEAMHWAKSISDRTKRDSFARQH